MAEKTEKKYVITNHRSGKVLASCGGSAVQMTANGGERVLPDIAASIEEKMGKYEIEQDEVAGVGIGVPGPVDAEGTVYKTANLGWDTVFNIPEAFRKHLDVPVMAGNDANVAALGEMWQGGGKGFHPALVGQAHPGNMAGKITVGHELTQCLLLISADGVGVHGKIALVAFQ